MVQESISKKTVAIIGAGPAGCICAYFLQDKFEVSLFDKGKFLRTILPTGGGRCNICHAEYDFKDLAKNYPRGEKFLYSIFSRFGTKETINLFDSIGIKTYTQDDNRIFPISNSAKDVQMKILNTLKNTTLVNENIKAITKLNNGFNVESNKSKYLFDYVVIAIGGHSDYSLLKNMGIPIIDPTQALVGLITKENLSELAGLSLKNITVKFEKQQLVGDILFTHKGVSGPAIYKLSSINARRKMPYQLNLKLIDDINLQQYLNDNSHKEIKNLIAQFVPKSLANFILDRLGIESNILCHSINGKVRDTIINELKNFQLTIVGKVADGEVVTCGGVDLTRLHSKTLEYKNISGLYFCGEVLDIDGFCGGFNLQNCWSTGFVVADSIINS